MGVNNPFGTADLGYYVGYVIASRYYDRAPDKAAAIKAMLELDYADQAAGAGLRGRLGLSGRGRRIGDLTRRDALPSPATVRALLSGRHD